jgi:hypothetical protein
MGQAQQARLAELLKGSCDLGDRALRDAAELDSAAAAVAAAAAQEAERRGAAGRAVLEQLKGVAGHGAALCRTIRAGREELLEVLAHGQDAVHQHGELERACAAQLEECAAFVGQAADVAAQAREGVRRRLRAGAEELAAVGAGIEAAREGVEGALADNVELRQLLEESATRLSVRWLPPCTRACARTHTNKRTKKNTRIHAHSHRSAVAAGHHPLPPPPPRSLHTTLQCSLHATREHRLAR